MHNNSNHDGTSQVNYNRNSNEYFEPLREPVAFEDFQFSLGLDPDFSMPIQIDIDIPPTFTNNSSYIPPTPSFSSENMNTSVLNEQDQKAFSQFLDQFYVDPNMQIDPQPFNFYAFDEEQNRQTNLIQTLEVPKKMYKENTNSIYPQHAPMDIPFHKNSECPKTNFVQEAYSSPNSSNRKAIINKSKGGGPIRRGKFSKELLTEEEKRNNHIASEQKRRGMIRSGFKELTEIVPGLKSINHSKSTVLFKAVEFIQVLEKKNKNLREKIKGLELRAEVEGRTGKSGRPTHQLALPSSPTQAALMQHKSQQKQLYELQEQLQHRKKIASQQKRFSSNNNSSSFWHNESKKSDFDDIVSA